MSLVDAIPQSIREVGRLQGAAAGQRQQAIGQSIATLGQIPIKTMAIREQLREGERRDRLAGIQEKELGLRTKELEMKTKEQERTDKAQQVYAQALGASTGPDGKTDWTKVRAAVAGTEGIDLMKFDESIANLQKTQGDLAKSLIDRNQAEVDWMASLAAGAKAIKDPTMRGKFLASGISSGMRDGLVPQAHGQEALARFTKEGTDEPDLEKIDSIIEAMIQQSPKQREVASGELRDKAYAQNVKTTADRDARQTAALELSNARTPQEFAARLKELSPDLQRIFPTAEDAMADFKGARERALDLGATVGQLLTQGNRDDAAAAKLAAKNDISSPETERDYKDFVAAYLKENPKAGKPKTELDDDKTWKPVPAPPTKEKWFEMTAMERQQVIKEPDNRINDYDMDKRRKARERGTPGAAGDIAVGKKYVLASGERVVVTKVYPDGTYDVEPLK